VHLLSAVWLTYSSLLLLLTPHNMSPLFCCFFTEPSAAIDQSDGIRLSKSVCAYMCVCECVCVCAACVYLPYNSPNCNFIATSLPKCSNRLYPLLGIAQLFMPVQHLEELFPFFFNFFSYFSLFLAVGSFTYSSISALASYSVSVSAQFDFICCQSAAN